MTRGSRKIAVIGAGNVGATCAFVLANMKIADIVLLDIYEGFAKGKALDMSQNANVLNYDGKITGTSSYEDIAGADVVVVTSGFPRQPVDGEERWHTIVPWDLSLPNFSGRDADCFVDRFRRTEPRHSIS